MRLFWQYFSLSLKSQMEYKLSFALVVVSQTVALFINYLFINALFDRFGSLQQFSRHEVLLAFGAVTLGYGLAEILMRGFDRFSHQIVGGNFDRLLVRPRPLLLQVMGLEFYFARISKIIEALIILGLSIAALDIVWTADKVIVLLLMILGAFCVFSGIFILGASFCFVTIQGLEVINILVDGGREAAMYPMAIYAKEFLFFFTFFVPLACVNSYPLLYLIGRSSADWYALTPIYACCFLVPCCLVWLRMAKAYQSTGS